MNLLHFCKAIRQIRVINNFTQEYVAFEIGVSQNHYSRIEKGNVNISLLLADKIANTFGLSLEELIKYQKSISFNSVV